MELEETETKSLGLTVVESDMGLEINTTMEPSDDFLLLTASEPPARKSGGFRK